MIQNFWLSLVKSFSKLLLSHCNSQYTHTTKENWLDSYFHSSVTFKILKRLNLQRKFSEN